MRYLLALIAVLALTVAACSGEEADEGNPADYEEVSEPESEPEPEPEPEPEEEPEPEPDPEPQPVAPLTGSPIADEDDLERPVAAIKIDNHPRARPPSGLEDADIVMTAVIEGGETRFVALFHSTDPGRVGPIRSARETDANLLPAFDPVVGISGAAPPVHSQLANAGLLVYEEAQVPGFERDPSRRAPHNLYVSPSGLWDAAGDLPPASEPWPIDALDLVGADPAEPPEGGGEIDGIDLRFSPYASAAWRWDGERWLRDQQGGPHLDDAGEQFGAANVVVVRVGLTPVGRTDAANQPVYDLDIIGEGEAVVLRDGRAYEAHWRKDGAGEQFRWETPDGEPLPLGAGPTWVEFVPLDGTADLVGPPGEAADEASEGDAGA